MSDLVVQTLLCIPVLIFNGYLAIRIHDLINRIQEKRFLKYVKIKHPEGDIIFTAVETSDHKALAKIKAQLDAR